MQSVGAAKDEQCPRSLRSGVAATRLASTISLLRPENRPRGQRFETLQDARAESERSEKLLRSFSGGSRELAEFLQECRASDYECHRSFCPICARQFRRWFIAQLLRVTKGHDPVYIYTVLLKESSHDRINDLDPAPYQHLLRKRLERAGRVKVPVIGGFEIVTRRPDVFGCCTSTWW